MSFKEVPTPVNETPIKNPDLSTDIEVEMFALQEEAEKLRQEVEALETDGINNNIDEKKKGAIFTQARKITYAVAALVAIPLAAGLFNPERTKEIKDVMSALVDNNIAEMLAAFGVILAAGTIYVVRSEIENNKNRSLCRKIFKTMVEKTESNNWDDLCVDLDNFKELFEKTVFSSYESEKKERKYFQDELSAVKEKLEAQPDLDKADTILKLNTLISSLNH